MDLELNRVASDLSRRDTAHFSRDYVPAPTPVNDLRKLKLLLVI